MYDLIVIGAGPGGTRAATLAAKAGLKVLLVEKEHVGGVCLNVGCIPTKTLVQAAAIVDIIKKGAEYGLQLSRGAINGEVLFAKKDAIVKQLRSGTEASIKKAPYEFMKGKAEFVSANCIKVEKKSFDFKHAIIATGACSRDLPGILCDGEHILNSEQLLALNAVPRSIVIIGGGYIGCEWASILSSLDCKVTILEITETLLPSVSAGIVKRLETHFEKKGIGIRKRAKVIGAQVSDAGVSVMLEQGEVLKAEKVLVSVGRKANIDTCSLEKAGVMLRNDFILTDKHLATNVMNIYAIGDVINAPQLAHAAFHEADIAVKNILVHGSAEVCYQTIPGCIFTDPEIAFVGDLKQRDGLKETRVLYGSNGKAHCEGAAEGILVIRTDHHNMIVGAELIGKHASELISYIALAMKLRIPVNELAKVTFPHPTLSEIIGDAFLAAV